MAIFKYKNPTTNEWEAVIGGGGTANGIPITSNPSDDTTVWIDTSEDGGVVSSTHASTHASDGSDPITPESIGAIRTYTSIADLGLTTSNVTMDTILAKMAVGSQLLTYNAMDWPSGVLPTTHGTLFVQKIHNARIVSWYFDELNDTDVYIGMTATGNVFAGWVKLATIDYALNKAGDTMTGALDIENADPYIFLKDTSTDTGAVLRQLDNVASLTTRDVADSTDTYRMVKINNRTAMENFKYALQFYDQSAVGSGATYNILHTGNTDIATPTSLREGYLRYFTSLTPLGITKGEETIASMIAAMPNYSMLMLQVNTESDGYNPVTYPSAWGLLTIKKYNNYRVEIDYMDIKSNPKTFYKKAWNNGTESDWLELLHTGNKNLITPADIGALPTSGTAAAATKLATARTIRTNLASTSTASFDGSANVTPGVTGTLAIGNGGTGYASLADTTYTTARYRGSAIFANDSVTDPTVNGVIHWAYV